MKRVASLYLPDWSIDRVRRAEPTLAPPPERAPTQADLALGTRGWRPGARWARSLRGDDGGPATDMPARVFRDPPLQGEVAGRRPDGRVSRFEGDSPGSNRIGALVTVHKTGSRVEIAAASPQARALGIAPGMALTQARASVPALVVRDADPVGDAAELHALATLFARRWSPIVALDGADGLLLDLTGVAHLHGGEARMARTLVRLLARAGITARIAIADTAGAAWAIARFTIANEYGIRIVDPPLEGEVAGRRPDGGVSPAAIEAHPLQRGTPLHRPAGGSPPLAGKAHPACLTILASLPVAALRLDSTACDLLARLGVDTIGDLAAMPRAPLIRRFGAQVALRLDQALGPAPEPLVPVLPPERIAVKQRFAEPIATAEAIAHWLAPLVTRLAVDLTKAGLGARMLAFVATRVDDRRQVLRIGLARATRDPAHMLRLLARRIETIDPGFGIEALALHVHRADPLDAQPFDDDLVARTADLAPLIDTLANRVGAARLWRATPVESDVPERSTAAIPPLDPPARDAPILKPEDIRRLDRRGADHPWHPRWPRPIRLLRRPEPLDHVVAELPDLPPRRFTWRGDRHVVVRADGPERIEGEWWKRSSERHAVRDYFQVEDEAGHRFWLFRRGDGMRAETGDLAWFIHGSFG